MTRPAPLTTKQVADMHMVSPRRILAIAKARGIPGTRYGSVIVWTWDEMRALKPGAPGRPKASDPGDSFKR